MRKALMAMVLLAAVAALMLVGGVGKVSVANASNAALHIDDFGCTLLDGNGGPVFTTESQSVITYSGNGNMTCAATVTPSSTGHAVVYNFANTGFLCAVAGDGFTDRWTETVSAKGNATLRCHSRP